MSVAANAGHLRGGVGRSCRTKTGRNFIFSNGGADLLAESLAPVTITGFDPAQDILQLDRSLASSFAQIQPEMSGEGPGAYLHLGVGNSICLAGVDPGSCRRLISDSRGWFGQCRDRGRLGAIRELAPSMRLFHSITLAVFAIAAPARADVTLGALLSLTGPGAGLGIPERNTIELLPTSIAGQAVRWAVLDDASDTTAAVRLVRKMIDDEHVDAVIGASTTPNSIAILDAIGASGTPAISLAGSSAVIEPAEGARRWAFKLIPSETVATVQIVDHMLKTGKKTLGNIGFANSLGDGYIGALNAQAGARGIQTVAEVRYNPGDQSVTPQVLRLLAAKPDAVFVAASSAPAVTPIIELRSRGFAGPIYTVQGIAGPDALRVGGKSLDGVMFSSVPVLVAEQMPDGNAVKGPALAYVAAYEGKYGAGSRSLFGATLWDAFALVQAGVPGALEAGAPGTAAFRTGLRDAMERVQGLALSEAVFSLTPADHSGAQADSQVMVEIRGGAYRVLP